MLHTKAVKTTALAILKNNWPGAIIAAVIPLAFFLSIANILSLLAAAFSTEVVYVTFGVVMFFVGIPLILGVLRYFWGLCTESSITLAEVFFYFSSLAKYKKAVAFLGLLFGKLFLQAVALLLPSIIIDLMSRFPSVIFADSATPIWFSNLWIFSLVLRVIAYCIIAFIALRYYPAFFMFVSQDDLNIKGILEKSYIISRFFAGDFLSLTTSLLGWVVLSVFFVPLIFTLPYMFMCYMVHSRYCAVNYNLKLKGVKGE